MKLTLDDLLKLTGGEMVAGCVVMIHEGKHVQIGQMTTEGLQLNDEGQMIIETISAPSDPVADAVAEVDAADAAGEPVITTDEPAVTAVTDDQAALADLLKS